MWSWFTNHNLDTNDGDSFAEGIGQGRVTKNLEGLLVNKAYRIEDQAALTVIQYLCREEGIFLGLSAGVNIVGAARYAKAHGPGQTVVTILCDSGHKYISRLYNPDWLAQNGFQTGLKLESIFA